MVSNHFAALREKFRHHPQLAAIGFMLISTTGFSAMSVGVRLAADELDPTLIVTLRNFLTLMLLMPFALRHNAALIRTTRLKAHAWRGCLGSIGMIAWTYCLTIMPLAHATALSFTAPLFSTLFAIMFLKEHADKARWLAIIAGFFGTLVILRPSLAGFQWNELLVMFATSAWAITGMFVKSLSRTEPALRMVFYMNLFMFLMALPFGLMHWQAPTAHAWLVLLVIAICSIIMHFSMARAYALAPVVTLMPFDFTRLISSSLFAYFLFGETSDALTWLGAAIIVASAVAVARRDVKAPPATVIPE
ncbi:MAG: DMT family transporter [Pseudomonadota bacterium]